MAKRGRRARRALPASTRRVLALLFASNRASRGGLYRLACVRLQIRKGGK